MYHGRKPVRLYCVQTATYYGTIALAAKKLGISSSNICIAKQKAFLMGRSNFFIKNFEFIQDTGIYIDESVYCWDTEKSYCNIRQASIELNLLTSALARSKKRAIKHGRSWFISCGYEFEFCTALSKS